MRIAAGIAAPPGAREQLLDTASAIMREGDIVDISLSELSLRSGLNSALVKYYFGNKAGLLMALLFDYALIGLSSLLGAEMVVTAFPIDPAFRWLALAALVVVGIVVQGVMLARETPEGG